MPRRPSNKTILHQIKKKSLTRVTDTHSPQQGSGIRAAPWEPQQILSTKKSLNPSASTPSTSPNPAPEIFYIMGPYNPEISPPSDAAQSPPRQARHISVCPSRYLWRNLPQCHLLPHASLKIWHYSSKQVSVLDVHRQKCLPW